jgi:alginate O-acetyltransferase complex protein AlgI
MAFDSFFFLIFIACFLACFLTCRRPERRRWMLTAANAFFIASFFTSPAHGIPLVIFLVAGFAAVALSQRTPQRASIPLGIGLMIALFIYFKKYSLFSFLPFLRFPYAVVGLSYVFFRIVHLIVDVHQGAVREKVSLLSYFNYVCFFPCFVSGPIQLYQEYRDSESKALRASALSREEIDRALRRIVIGYFEVVVLSAAVKGLFDPLHKSFFCNFRDPAITLCFSLFCAACFPAYIYWNFKGYMDVVIGVANLMDFKLPENFNRPFSATNFLEFWSRWHMTLSQWFKLYLFNPFLKILIARSKTPAQTAGAGIIAFFLTFFLMGMWHGTSVEFSIYGLLLGIGVTANKLYQTGLIAIIGKKRYRKLCSQRLYVSLCRGCTIGYFSVAVTCLWSNTAQLSALCRGLGAFWLTAGFFILATAMAFILAVADKTTGRCNIYWTAFHPKVRTRLSFIGLGAVIFIISVVEMLNRTAPDIYYKLF